MKRIRILFALLPIGFIAYSQAPSYVPSTGLVGWWPFDGNPNDLSGNGFNGVVSGATLATDRFGNTNYCYQFNGTSDFITVSNSPFTNGPFSISAWVNVNQFSQGNPIVGLGDLGSTFLKKLYFAPNYGPAGTPGIGTSGANGINSTSNAVQTNQWINIVLVFNSYSTSGVEFYVNGTLLGANTTQGTNVPFPLNNSGFNFGKHTMNTGTEYFNGKLDDIGIWDRALTQQEITDLYQACNVTATISPLSSTTFCQGGSVTLQANTGSGYSYEWYNNGVLINGATQNTYNATTSGNYTVKVINGSCNALSSITSVIVNPTPSNGVILSGSTTFCSGGSVTLTAEGVGSYSWSNGATTQSITVTQGGNYFVTVTNNGCSSVSNNNTVTVNQTPTAVIIPSGNTTFCQGGFVTLTASGGQNYQWSSGSTSAAIIVNQSGNYSVAVTTNGCTGYSSQNVTVYSNPTVTLQSLSPFINYFDNPISLTGTPTGGVYSGEGVTSNTFSPQQAGLGTVNINYSYTDQNGCIGSASTSTIVYDTLGTICTSYDTVYTAVTDTLIINTTLSLLPPNDQNTILIYPNPTSDYITIDNGNYSSMTGYSILIENNAGQQVFQSLITQAQYIIDLSTWTGDGLYFVHLINPQGETVTVRKIVLQ
jgi:hypothetical protein